MESALGKVLQDRLRDLLRLRAPLKSEPVDVILITGQDAELKLRLWGWDWGSTPRITVGQDWRTLANAEAGSLSQVSHRTAGGVTNWTGSVVASGWKFAGWAPKVRQDVSHVIKYSEQPKCCNKSPPFPHIASDALLPVYGPWEPVVFHTYATRTNWGARPLLSCELAGALDLPVWVMEDNELLRHWIPSLHLGEPFPLKVLQATLESFFATDVQGPERTKESPFPAHAQFSGRTVHPKDPDVTTLKGSSNDLPGNWVEAGEVMVEACKKDDAVVSTRMWDLRILLVLPWISRGMLEFMRGWLLQLWNRRLTGSFKEFLCRKYGNNWNDLLSTARNSQQNGMNAGAAHERGGKAENDDRNAENVDKEARGGNSEKAAQRRS